MCLITGSCPQFLSGDVGWYSVKGPPYYFLKSEDLKIIKLLPASSVLDKGLWVYISFQRLVKAFGLDEWELRVFLIEE